MCDKHQLQSILREIYDFSNKKFGDKLDSVILYGSYARGDYHDESDVDVMVLADIEEKVLYRYARDFDSLSSDLSLSNGLVVCVTLKSLDIFKRYKNDLPFLRNVDREGVRVIA